MLCYSYNNNTSLGLPLFGGPGSDGTPQSASGTPPGDNRDDKTPARPAHRHLPLPVTGREIRMSSLPSFPAQAVRTRTEPASTSPVATRAVLAARLDRLPASKSMWRLVVLLSLGGFFEFYELFSTAYVLPGIVRSGILTPTTAGFFALSGVASYIAATFAGLFIGTFAFGFVADKCGRRAVFTYSLLWYSACAVVMAFQTDAAGLNFWRFMTGIGLGVELVTIDAYLSELVPPQMRGRAFALNQVIT